MKFYTYGNSYQSGDIVIYNDFFYKAIIDISQSLSYPDEEIDWERIPIPLSKLSELSFEYHLGIDYRNSENPTPFINPIDKGVIWLNENTGEMFVCIDNTIDNNKWQGTSGTFIQKSTLLKFDIFDNNTAIACYPFDRNANDLGGEYDGDWIGGAEYQLTDKFKYGAKFRGAEGIKTHIETPDEFTFSTWINIERIERGWSTFFKTDNNRLQVGTYDDKFAIWLSGYGALLSNKQFELNKTYHVTFVLNGTTMKYYIDGEEVFNKTDLYFSGASSGKIILGYWDRRNQSLIGWMDETRIFNSELTLEQIQQLYNEQ